MVMMIMMVMVMMIMVDDDDDNNDDNDNNIQHSTYHAHSNVAMFTIRVSWPVKSKITIIASKKTSSSNGHLEQKDLISYCSMRPKWFMVRKRMLYIIGITTTYLGQWRVNIKKELSINIEIGMFSKMSFIPATKSTVERWLVVQKAERSLVLVVLVLFLFSMIVQDMNVYAVAQPGFQ